MWGSGIQGSQVPYSSERFVVLNPFVVGQNHLVDIIHRKQNPGTQQEAGIPCFPQVQTFHNKI